MKKNALSLLLPLVFIGWNVLCAQTYQVLSAEQTAHYSTRDTINNFFERIQPLEVSIQLKQSEVAELSQDQAAEALKNKMRDQAVAVTEEQKEVLNKAMQIALNRSQPLLEKHTFPDTVLLGVIRGDLYGPSVFFTRENGIYIPAPMVVEEQMETLIHVLIHEIFHIQSRYNPELQVLLYEQLGFYPMRDNPAMDSAFHIRTLLNPDGTDWNFYIPLKMGEKEVMAYPMVISKSERWSSSQSNFFDYLQFGLYPLKKQQNGYEVQYEEDFSGLPEEWMGPFFNTISDNTQYIIHPDELMADNFIILTQWLGENQKPERLSEKGAELSRRLAKEYGVKLP